MPCLWEDDEVVRRRRRSGRRYTTPIRVVEQPDGFIVPLTYGPNTSWYVNLQHNPGTLHWQP